MQFSYQHFETALNCEDYSKYSENLLTNISSDATNPMNGFAKTNLHILQRLQNSVQLTDALMQALQNTTQLIFVILTEGYCGDSAQSFPVFGKMQEMFPNKIEIKIVLRDKHLDIADNFFQTRAIPILICVDKQTLKVIFTWGNRPKPAQKIMADLKLKGASIQKKSVALHRWYAQDKTQSLQQEMTELLAIKCQNR